MLKSLLNHIIIVVICEDAMEKISKKDLLFVGLTLFSMFFGAGNLIFPPFLGEQAGTHAWIAFIGFLISAVGLPILGVIAVAKAGGLFQLASRVNKKFASVFTVLIYLSIGPFLAIPRTATTSFEMIMPPLFGLDSFAVRFGYSVFFFLLAFTLAMHPEKLTDRLGKILCPLLLVLITVIFIGSFFVSTKGYGVPQDGYAGTPLLQGFLEGYQTMDTIAALNFGIVVAMNIKNKGVKDNKMVVQIIIKSGFIAGLCLSIVYAMLLHIGGLSGGLLGLQSNGAATLSRFIEMAFSNAGLVIVGAIFFIACLNTSTSLICCCSQYFLESYGILTYKGWARLFTGVSFIISNVGLTMILNFSIPVLQFIYPIAIALIFLAFIDFKVDENKTVYEITILFTIIGSTILLLGSLDIINLGHSWLAYPLSWVVFTIVGTLLGMCLNKYVHKK